jgi:hypothetical protein
VWVFCLFETYLGPCFSQDGLFSCRRHVSTPALAFNRYRSGASMDLAMAMGLALFGIFTGSTVLFFYRLAR